MSEMVERMARAIVGCLDSFDGGGTPWDEATEGMRDEMRKMARTLIEAMREPTMDMESAAANWQGGQMTYSDVWRAMIDAAHSSTESRGEQ